MEVAHHIVVRPTPMVVPMLHLATDRRRRRPGISHIWNDVSVMLSQTCDQASRLT